MGTVQAKPKPGPWRTQADFERAVNEAHDKCNLACKGEKECTDRCLANSTAWKDYVNEGFLDPYGRDR
jgi:hypothetical protein